MKTTEHIIDCIKSLNESGLAVALKYDLFVTSIRHPKIASGIVDLLYIRNNPNSRDVAQGIILKSTINNLEIQKLYK